MGQPQQGQGQSVTYNGDTYSFPPDAKDEEILEFLHGSTSNSPTTPPRAPIYPSYNRSGKQFMLPQPMERSTGSPVPPPSAASVGMHPSFMVGDPNADATPQSPGQLALGVGRGVADVSAPTIGHRILQKVGLMGPHSRVYPGEATLQDLPQKVAMAGALPAAEGIASGAGEGLASALPKSSTVPASEVGVGSFTPQAADTGVNVRSAAAPESAASGARSGLRNAVGLARPLIRPHSIGSWMDAATSIKSILSKGGEAEVNPADPPLPHQSAGMGTHGVPVEQWGKRIPEPSRDLSHRAAPAWKNSPSAGGTPVESILSREPASSGPGRTTFPPGPSPARQPVWAGKDTSGTPVPSSVPHVTGDLPVEDLKAKVESLGGRGGKAQSARKLMRGNLQKVIDTSNQPTAESRAASDAAFRRNYPNDQMNVGSPLEKDLWQESVFGEKPPQDIGAKARQSNPEPTRAEVKAASKLKKGNGGK